MAFARRTHNRVILALLFVTGFFPAAECGQFPLAFSRERTAEGIRLRFDRSTALDFLSLPRIDSQLWGPGKIGLVAIVKTAHTAGLVQATGTETHLLWSQGDADTETVEIVPLLTAPRDTGTLTGEWHLEGVWAEQRFLENRLAAFGHEILARQQQRKCFSCHELLPFALSAGLAAKKGLSVPEALIASLGASLEAFQLRDGSFTFPEKSEYGINTPTLVAGMAMGILQDFSLRLAAPLLRTSRYLAHWLGPDGTMVADFAFPPIYAGGGFSGWALTMTFSGVEKAFRRVGLPKEPLWQWSMQRIDQWFADPHQTCFEKDFFRLIREFSAEVGRGRPEPTQLVRDNLREKHRNLDRSAFPGMAALLEAVLIHLGEHPQNPALWSTRQPPGKAVSYQAWKLYVDLLHFRED